MMDETPTADGEPLHRHRNKEETLIMEIMGIVQEGGGKAKTIEISNILQWSEKYEPVWKSITDFLSLHPTIFVVSEDDVSVQKDLTNKRKITEKGKQRIRHSVSAPLDHGKVASFCVADSIDLVSVQKHFKRRDLVATISDGILHVTNVKGYGSVGDSERFDAFVFSYGSVVWWGTDLSSFRTVELEFLRANHLPQLLCDRYPQNILDGLFPVWATFAHVEETNSEGNFYESERFISALQRDHILLMSTKPTYKHAMSHAFAQSAKLDVLEELVYDLLRTCKPLPVQIKSKGSTTVTPTDVCKLRGKLFLYRVMLKSDSELLDEPDFFWEQPKYKPLFTVVREDYNIESRANLLDDKLNAAQETLDMIANQFDQQHDTRMEWIVIVLIILEVVVGLIELGLELGFGASNVRLDIASGGKPMK